MDKSYLLSLSISILIALIIGAILMLATGFNPLDGYAAMIKGALGNARVFGNMCAKALSLCLTGLAMAVAARAGMFNVGGEGQLYLGGIAGTMTGVVLCDMPVFVALPAAFLVSAFVGGFYAWVPAILKVKLNVSEVITTIMLNSAAIYFCTWLCNGPLKTTEKGVLAGTEAVPEAFRFMRIIAKSNLTTALFYSAAIAFFVWYVMQKTSVGLEMKVTGENPRFSFFAGLPKDKLMIGSMIASGAICGLVGMFEVYGIQGRFLETISNEYYFDGMLVAMIMNYSPVGIIIMSFFFAILKVGASAMELSSGVSGEISDIIFAVIIFLMAAEGGISKSIKEKAVQTKAKMAIRNAQKNTDNQIETGKEEQ